MRRSREQLRQNQDEFAREVDRDRGPPSPVLHVSGLEMLSDLVNGKMLSRLDVSFWLFREGRDLAGSKEKSKEEGSKEKYLQFDKKVFQKVFFCFFLT